MEIVNFFQSISTLKYLSYFFDFIGSVPFFCIFLGFVFLFINKNHSFKLGLFFGTSFIVGGPFLGLAINSKQPFLLSDKLFTFNQTLCFGSNPSVEMMTSCGFSCYGVNNTKGKKKILTIFLSIFLLAMIGISKLFFAKNFLLDLVFGLILGFAIFYLINKYLKISFKTSLSLIIILVLLTFIYFNYWFKGQEYSLIFAFCGFMCSLILFMYLEDKYIKYSIKNNLFFNLAKICIFIVILFLFFFIDSLLFYRYAILAFVSYFILGFVIFLFLPYVFKKLEKHLYVYSKNVGKDVVFSSISLSEQNTKKIARKILHFLNDGDVVVLQGDLGAGKSAITRDILNLLNVNDKITSPTFTLVNEYKSTMGHFYHFDMYRIEDEDEVNNIGFEEILEDDKSIKFIEWAEKVPSYLPKCYKKITIVKLGKNVRNIIFENVN